MIARVELECAMAAIITSPGSKAHFEADAVAFAATFGLPDAELARLRRMGDDLGALTAGFVAKRATTLRWNSKRTLALLGPAANALVEEFVDEHPATESIRDEAMGFAGYVVERTAAGRDGSVRADVIAEMARFERSRSASFWGAVAEPAPPGAALRPALRLRPGVQVDCFDRDLRPLYHATTAVVWPQLDPCTLAFVHLGTAAGFRVLRLSDHEARLVASIAESDPSAWVFEQPALREAEAAGLTSRLVRGGVLEWV